jgi:hypothetical protein
VVSCGLQEKACGRRANNEMVDRGGGLGCCEEQEEGGGRERFTLFLWIMTRSCLSLLGSRRSRRLSHFKQPVLSVNKVISSLDQDTENQRDEKEKRRRCSVVYYLNLALACLRLRLTLKARSGGNTTASKSRTGYNREQITEPYLVYV